MKLYASNIHSYSFVQPIILKALFSREKWLCSVCSPELCHENCPWKWNGHNTKPGLFLCSDICTEKSQYAN